MAAFLRKKNTRKALFAALCIVLLVVLNSFGGADAALPALHSMVRVPASAVKAGTAAAITVNIVSSADVEVRVEVDIFDASLERVQRLAADRVGVEAGITTGVTLSGTCRRERPQAPISSASASSATAGASSLIGAAARQASSLPATREQPGTGRRA